MSEGRMDEYLAEVAKATEPPTDDELRSIARDALSRAHADGRRAGGRRPYAPRGQKVAVILAATALVIGASAATAAIVGRDSRWLALDGVFPKGECVTALQAIERINHNLDSLGYDDWAVAAGEAAESQGCVSAGLDVSAKTVVLIPVERPEVAAALQGVREELMSRCLNEEEARAFVSSVLTNTGATDWEIQSDGPLAYPVGQEKAVEDHLAAGCFVYSGSGHGSEGFVYYISGTNT